MFSHSFELLCYGIKKLLVALAVTMISHHLVMMIILLHRESVIYW